MAKKGRIPTTGRLISDVAHC